MTSVTLAAETTYAIDVIELSPDGALRFAEKKPSPAAAWYYERRRRALAQAGLIAAGNWNPLLHPRGPDGRFIRKFGFVRWLTPNGWSRGQVKSINPNGDVVVTPDYGDGPLTFSHDEASKKLYSLRKPKAKIDLPSPGNHKDAPGFHKTGHQAGSNPGGKYQVDKKAVGTMNFTPSIVKEVMKDKPFDKMDLHSHSSDEAVESMLGPLAIIQVDLGNGDESVLVGKFENDYVRLDEPSKSLTYEDIFGTAGSRTWRQKNNVKARALTDLDFDEMDAIVRDLEERAAPQAKMGDEFYIKSMDSKDRARNEVLANALYELGGVPVPDVSLGNDGWTVASKIVTGDEVTPLNAHLSDPAIMSKVREDMVFDAWLANWDVVGEVLDNIIVVDGMAYRIDAGGSLKYRAMGKAKGSMFGPKVGELETLRSGVNKQAKKVFGDATPGELKAGAERLALITNSQIHQMVEEHGLEPGLADILIARKKDILTQLGVIEPNTSSKWGSKGQKPPAAPDPMPLKTPQLQAAEETFPAITEPMAGKIYNPFSGEWETGTAGDYHALAADWENWLADATMEYQFEELLDGETYYVIEGDGQAWTLVRDDSDATMVNIGTGETKTMFVNPGSEFDVINPEPMNFEDFYQQKYAAMMTAAANNFSSPTWLEQTPQQYGRWYDLAAPKIPIDVTGFMDDIKDPQSVTGYRWLGFEKQGGGWQWVKPIAVNENGTYIAGVDTNGVPTEAKGKFVFGISNDTTNKSLNAIHSKNLIAAAKDADASKSNTFPKTPLDPTVEDSMDDVDVAETPLDVVLETDPEVNAESSAGTQTQSVATYTVSGVNSKIPAIGDTHSVPDLESEDWEFLVGKTVVIGPTEQGENLTPWFTGVWVIDSFSPKNDGTPYAISVTSQTGEKRNFYIHQFGSHISVTPVDHDPQYIANTTLKKDGTIVVNGVTVGKYFSSYHGWRFDIFPEHSVTGMTVKGKSNKKGYVKGDVAKSLYVPPKPGAVEKTPEAVETETVVKVEADKAALEPMLAMADGVEVKVGMNVISTKNGVSGKVTNITKTKAGALSGYITIVKPDGGKTTLPTKVFLKSADPAKNYGGGTTPEPFVGVKLKDGNGIYPGQHVTFGGHTGIVIDAKPGGGIKIVHSADGKAHWAKASEWSVAGPEYVPGSEVAVSAGGPGDLVAASAPSMPKVKAAKAGPGSPKYPGPGGATIKQSPDALTTWRAYVHDRKTTKDGYVPVKGMVLRDNKDEQHVVIAVGDPYKSNRHSVQVRNLSTGKTSWRQLSVFWVDHAAELSDGAGNPYPKISAATFDSMIGMKAFDGGSIYRVADPHERGTFRYYATRPGDAYVSVLTPTGWKSAHYTSINDPSSKIAVIDTDAPGALHVMKTGVGGTSQSLIFDKTDPFGLPNALKAYNEAQLEAQGAMAPFTSPKFEGETSLPSLPRGTIDAKRPPKNIPSMQADGSKIKETSAVAGAKTISDAAHELISMKDSTDANTGTRYSLGDSDYIEDMMIRQQVVVDKDTGHEYVELRFRLLEDKIDSIASEFLEAEGQKFGWWKHDSLRTTDLTVGDKIGVRMGHEGQLKPSSTNEPNAQIIEAPSLVGKSPNSGLDVYRVGVSTSDGTATYIMLEDRGTPSVDRYAWDDTMPTPMSGHSSSKPYHITPEAEAAGWKIRSKQIYYEQVGHGVIQYDETGKKRVSFEETQNGLGLSMAGSAELQFAPDGRNGSYVQLVAATPDVTSRDRNTGPRRSTKNGEVLIRVPVDHPDIESEISKMMSVVGVPPSAQGQPDGQQLTKYAMNVAFKQFSPNYKHQQKVSVTGNNDQTAQSVLSLLDKMTPSGTRAATMNDIRLRVQEDGRVNVVLSDEMADALADRAPAKWMMHHIYSGGTETIASILGAPTGVGVLSTDERMSMGINAPGMSPGSDTMNDAGNGVFSRLHSSPGIYGGNFNVVMTMNALTKNTGWYFNHGDEFGVRYAVGQGSNYYGVIQDGYQHHWLRSTGGSNNELTFKKRIEREMIAYILVPSQASKDDAVKKLHDRGVFQVNGRPIEEIILVNSTPTQDDTIKKIGQSFGTEIPLDTLAPAGVTPAVVAGGTFTFPNANVQVAGMAELVVTQ